MAQALPSAPRRVIVTRPHGQHQSLMQAIAGLWPHTEVVHQPLIRIEAVADTAAAAQLRQRMLNIDHYQAVIAISKNAAESGLRWLDQYWPQPPVDIRWYGVGPTTADALSQELQPVEMPPQRFDSEGLLQLPSLQQVAGEKILIWRGVGGRETLAEVLRQRGAQVDYAELYQRQQIDYAAQQWQSLLDSDTLLLLSSGQALDIVQQQVPDLAQRVGGVLLPSERVAAQAAQQGFSQVLVAASARDQDVLAQLRNWASRKQ